MRLLVLGGTVFLSRAVAAEAVRRGHEVTCACRGSSGSAPEGARLEVWDRSGAAPAFLDGGSDAGSSGESGGGYDAVMDVARQPSWVRSAVALLPDAHWVFVSTINVYADEATPGGRPGVTPLREPISEDVDLTADGDAYGPMKVACEQIVAAGAASSMVIRPGLIVGPEDPTGRFTYWASRFGDVADGSGAPEVLAPGRPADSAQVVDVRDLAAWIVDSAESRRTGVFDGVGPVQPLGELLDAVAEGCRAPVGASGGAERSLTWVDQGFLAAAEVDPWSGPRSIPLFLPRPEYDGLLAHDASPSLDAGLVLRPLVDTARDTLAWLRSTPGAEVTGLTRAEEAEVLRSWHASRDD